MFVATSAGLVAGMLDEEDDDEDESASLRRPYRSRASTARGGTRVHGQCLYRTCSSVLSLFGTWAMGHCLYQTRLSLFGTRVKYNGYRSMGLFGGG